MECGHASELTHVEGDGGGHALVIVIHNRAEHRGLLQAADDLHLRQVLVALGNAVDTGAAHLLRLVPALVLGDHLLAAAGVAGEGEAAEVRVLGQQAQLHQRRDRADKARGVAAGVGHPLGRRNGLPLPLLQLRETVDPAGSGAVGGGGVDDPGVGIVHQGHGLPGRRVRQAEKHNIRRVHELFPLLRVLALGLVDQQQVDVRPEGQPVVDLQARGALLAVNIHLWFQWGHLP